MKVLVVEDEKSIAEPVSKFLIQHGFVVDIALSGAECFSLLEVNEYDVMLLDLNLPDIDGLEIAKTLRESGNTIPIIMLTARSQVYDKLDGFEVGADDYITKPFALPEVVARIKAVIKRSSENKESNISFGEYTFYPSANRLEDKTGKQILLSTKETEILEYLLRKRGSAVSSEELLEHVWNDEIDPFTDTVKTHIKTLRKKIDPRKKLIKTIRGRGYIIE